MKLSHPLPCLLLAVSLATGCVTEPGPDDTTVFGHFDQPRKMKQKRVKPQPMSSEAPSGPVTVEPGTAN